LHCLPTKQHPESLFVEYSLEIFGLLQQGRILFTGIGYLLHQQDTCCIDRTLGTLTGHFVTLIGHVCYVDRTLVTLTGHLLHQQDSWYVDMAPVTSTGHLLQWQDTHRHHVTFNP